MKYDDRHGGPFDRGSADSYYRRGYDPHYYIGATHSSPRVELADMNPGEITAYTKGFNENEDIGMYKEW
jgi:hypothetical protein|tara:strand:- start:8201 stop:8407 length:207 start_codon:yes stop_codon:yes gene_type:complete